MTNCRENQYAHDRTLLQEEEEEEVAAAEGHSLQCSRFDEMGVFHQ
jgi:hypothetical protein